MRYIHRPKKLKILRFLEQIKMFRSTFFFKDEIINVSFDELSYNTNNYYYSIDHYDFQWNKTNIFKNEFISGYDDIRISNFNKSLNTLQKYTNYTFSFPNNSLKLKFRKFILSLKDRLITLFSKKVYSN